MKIIIVSLLAFGFINFAFAEDTPTEKAQESTNTVTRTIKKGVHRTGESLCGTLTGDNKVQCLAKEAKHHLEEGKDFVKDKASETKTKLDPDKK